MWRRHTLQRLPHTPHTAAPPPICPPGTPLGRPLLSCPHLGATHGLRDGDEEVVRLCLCMYVCKESK